MNPRHDRRAFQSLSTSKTMLTGISISPARSIKGCFPFAPAAMNDIPTMLAPPPMYVKDARSVRSLSVTIPLCGEVRAGSVSFSETA
jgi:hypothetical protein